MKPGSQSIFKELHFRVSCITDGSAFIYFTSNETYVVTGLIVSKWLLVLLYYPLQKLINGRKEEK